MRNLLRISLTSLFLLGGPVVQAQESNLSLRVLNEQVANLQSQVDVLRRSLGNSKLGTQQQINDGIRAAEIRWLDDAQRRMDLAARDALRSAVREIESELNGLRAQAKSAGPAAGGIASAAAPVGLVTQMKALQDRLDGVEQQLLRASLNPKPVGVVAPPEDLGPRIDKAVAASEARMLEAINKRPPSPTDSGHQTVLKNLAEMSKRIDVLHQDVSASKSAAPIGVTPAQVEQSVSAASRALEQSFERRAQVLSTRIDSLAAATAATSPESGTGQKVEDLQREFRTRLDLAERTFKEEFATQNARIQAVAKSPAPLAPAGSEESGAIRQRLEAALEQSNARAQGLETRIAALESENARLVAIEGQIGELLQWKNSQSLAGASQGNSGTARSRSKGTYLRYPVRDAAGADEARAEALVASASRVELLTQGNAVVVEVGPIADAAEAAELKKTLDKRIGTIGTLESVP